MPVAVAQDLGVFGHGCTGRKQAGVFAKDGRNSARSIRLKISITVPVHGSS
jgi:hypothetical protein